MKRITISFFCVLAVIAFVIVYVVETINTDGYTNAVAVFKYENKDIRENLNAEELETIKKLFDGKLLYSGSPSCGFSEDIALIFDGDKVFSLACDGCAVIYFEASKKYFKLKSNEYERLKAILCAHGFVFPCI